MPLYKVVIRKAWGGRSTFANTHSNTYYVSYNGLPGDAAMSTMVDNIVAWEKRFHLAQVHFMNATISVPKGVNASAAQRTTRVIELPGTGMLGNRSAMPKEVGVRVKFGAGVGRSVANFYRGAIDEGAVNSDSTGQGTIVNNEFIPHTHLETTGIPLITPQDGAQLVLKPTKEEGINGNPRPVTVIAVAGIGNRQTRVRRKKKEANNDDTALDFLGEALDFVAPILVGLLSKRLGGVQSKVPQLLAKTGSLKTAVDTVTSELEKLLPVNP